MTFKSLKPALLFTLLLAVMALFLTAGSYQPAAAGEDLKTPDEARLTETMRRMLADQKPAENLQPLPFTPCVGGMAGSYPCENVDLMAFMPLATIGGGNGNDVWGWTDPQTGKEYAIMGRTNGSAFVDISDPVNPIYLGNLPTQTGNSTWRDIKVYNNYAFIVSEASGHGMQVFDLTRLRSVPTPPVTFTVDAHYNQFGNAHNIAINEESGFAYAIGSGTCSGGLHMVNIQNPLAPTNAGCFSADGYTHDTQCVTYNGPDTDHVGDEICFNSNEDTVTIVDVTNKAAPVQLARQGYAGSAYTHQGWLTEDHTYFLVDDELDEQSHGHNTRTYIWDVSDLEAPTLIGNFDSPVPAIDHNLYTKDGYVYQGNYRAGLRILDAANVASGSLTQYGYFDIYPTSNSAQFNGAWSVFPYYESGVVVVSGIEQGLFILRPTGLHVAEVDLEVTAGLDPHTCASTDSLNLAWSGDEVTYCYTVANTGTFTLTNHDLVDSEWGSLLNNFPYTLAPGASFHITLTTFVTETTINNATWTADDGTETASDTDSVTVNVALPAPAVAFTLTVGLDSNPCSLTNSVTLPPAGGDVFYCYMVANTGDITLTHHTVTDSEFGYLLNNFPYNLAPGASTFITVFTTITEDVTNTGTWTAYNGSLEASDVNTASVTVSPFDLVVSADQTLTGTAGSAITYTITITNAGHVTDTAELMAMGQSWDTTYPMTVTIGSGETVEVEIMVMIPVTATAGMSDTAMIHVTSAGDSGEMEMVSLTTVVGMAAQYRLYLPVINRAEE